MPLISIKIMMKNHTTNFACWVFSLKLENENLSLNKLNRIKKINTEAFFYCY